MRASSIAVVMMSAAGAALCLYALRVQKHNKDINYKPLCDFSTKVSCSGVVDSPQAYLLSYTGLVKRGSFVDVPNAALGLVFYSFMASFPFGRWKFRSIYLGASIVSLVLSFFTVYTLATAFHKLCPVCMGISMINFAIFGAIMLGRPHKEKVRPTSADHKRKRG